MRSVYLYFFLFAFSAVTMAQEVEIQVVPEVQGQFVNYHVKVGGFENMVGAQGTFEWDPDSIDFFEVSYIALPGMNSNNFNLTQADSGRLVYLWFGVGSGFTLEACETLFTFRFRILKGVAELRQRQEGLLAVEFTNSDFEQVGVTTFMVEECVYSSVENPSVYSKKVSFFPNPVRAGELIHLKFNGETGPNTIELFDPLGRSFLLHAINTSNGIAFPIPAQLPSGIYRLRLNQPGNALYSLIIIN